MCCRHRTGVAETYVITFPVSVQKSLEFFSFVNLELDGFGLPLACFRLGSFQDKLTFMYAHTRLITTTLALSYAHLRIRLQLSPHQHCHTLH